MVDDRFALRNVIGMQSGGDPDREHADWGFESIFVALEDPPAAINVTTVLAEFVSLIISEIGGHTDQVDLEEHLCRPSVRGRYVLTFRQIVASLTPSARAICR
jgi:hypothetical protein